LDFDLVDDICLAVSTGEVSPADLPSTRTQSLGAFLELSHVLPIESSSQDWLKDNRFQPILDAKKNGKRCYQSGALHLGFTRIEEFINDETSETDFYIKARRAVALAGFRKAEAGQFVAAIVELYSNVIEHSGSAAGAYVAFAAYENCFEFVVADHGIGLLESLKSNSKYESIKDSGNALELALTEGVSRHDGNSGRGRGFRPIFVGLANVSESLRFRSGDHGRELKRLDDGRIPAVTRQKSELPGFFCSVRCISSRSANMGSTQA
jgi:anti-sigma regulatory factor (Ser/Thr protein kinase)